MNSNYNLVVETVQRDTIDLKVFDASYFSKDYLDSQIQTGSIISFPRGNIDKVAEKDDYSYPKIEDETWFEDGVNYGSKRADRIDVLYCGFGIN